MGHFFSGLEWHVFVPNGRFLVGGGRVPICSTISRARAVSVGSWIKHSDAAGQVSVDLWEI